MKNHINIEILPFLINQKEIQLSIKVSIENVQTVGKKSIKTPLDIRLTAQQEQETANPSDPYLPEFIQQCIDKLRFNGQYRTSKGYASMLKSLRAFDSNMINKYTVGEITSQFVESYEKHLQQRGLTLNTISYYLRILRAVYYRIVERGSSVDRKPFRNVFTGVENTKKRALSLNDICRIAEAGSRFPQFIFCIDMFLFSFYTRGMSLIDMALLRKTDVHNGYLCYKRKKTGQRIDIKWEPCMHAIVSKYEQRNGKFLLPLAANNEEDWQKQYQRHQQKINRQLRKVGEILNLPLPLTMYVARHSWASIAQELHVPISIITAGMGHNSEQTTRIYLNSLNKSLIDEANKSIINKVKRRKTLKNPPPKTGKKTNQ